LQLYIYRHKAGSGPRHKASKQAQARSCPALKGCHSQGRTREEALKNIREAIQEWLAAEAEEAKLFEITEAEVMV
jgi:hypothetical protein